MSHRRSVLCSAVVLLIGISSGCGSHGRVETAKAPTPPATSARPVVDLYHGTEVTDPYRWLEDWDDPEVREWSESQNRYARTVLDELPATELLRARLKEILGATASVNYFWLSVGGERLFAMKLQPPSQQPVLVAFDSPQVFESETVLVDPMALDPSGSTTIDFYKPSPDGRLVAVSMSKGGSESGDLTIYDVATGERVFESIPRVHAGTGGGDVAWLGDASGFYYTRYPRAGERAAEDSNFYQELWVHELGTPIGDDRYEIGKDFPKIAEIRVEMNHASGRVLMTVQKGDGGEFAHYIRQLDGSWQQFSRFEDSVVEARFSPSGDLYLLTFEDAPRGRIVRVGSENPDLNTAEPILAEQLGALESSFYNYFSPTFLVTDSLLFVIYQVGGPTELKVFDYDGTPRPAPTQLEVSSVYGLAPVGGDDILFANQSYIDAKRWLRFDSATGETRGTPLSSTSPVDLSAFEVVRVFATSKDGTRVPVNIVRPRGAPKDGSSPILVTGYGGYGSSQTPYLVSTVAPLLELGFSFAEVNLRGGSEYGEEWHEQGRLTDKQNVFDDFVAAIEHLLAEGYADPEKVAIMGGSNGGLLMGAVMTQDPNLVQAVVSFVGIYDMLRVELSPNGQFNIPEFGTVENRDHFEAMYAYSPYHHVVDGTAYPPTLFLTGANDPRVDPMQSRKMTARLQAAQGGAGPILLRTDPNAGHGIGSSIDQTVEEYTDAYAFILNSLGVARTD